MSLMSKNRHTELKTYNPVKSISTCQSIQKREKSWDIEEDLASVKTQVIDEMKPWIEVLTICLDITVGQLEAENEGMSVKEMAKIFKKKKGMDISNKIFIKTIGPMSSNAVKMNETVENERSIKGDNLYENTHNAKTAILLEPLVS